jgi:hypothetical protein
MMRIETLVPTALIAFSCIAGVEVTFAGQVPVVRPSNLGVSSPTLPRPISAAPSLSTGTVSTGGNTSLGLGGVSPTGQQLTSESTGLVNIPSATVISAVISDVSAAVNKSSVALSASQRTNLARTVATVLENVPMSTEQRAQLISIRENLEHKN